MQNVKKENERPLMFVLPGLTSSSSTNYVRSLSSSAYEQRGFDIVAINYRGFADCPLTSPKFYTSETWEDIAEIMHYF